MNSNLPSNTVVTRDKPISSEDMSVGNIFHICPVDQIATVSLYQSGTTDSFKPRPRDWFFLPMGWRKRAYKLEF